MDGPGRYADTHGYQDDFERIIMYLEGLGDSCLRRKYAV